MFLDETKTAIHSKHLHTNVTEMYGKEQYVEINDNKAMTVSWKCQVVLKIYPDRKPSLAPSQELQLHEKVLIGTQMQRMQLTL